MITTIPDFNSTEEALEFGNRLAEESNPTPIISEMKSMRERLTDKQQAMKSRDINTLNERFRIMTSAQLLREAFERAEIRMSQKA